VCRRQPRDLLLLPDGDVCVGDDAVLSHSGGRCTTARNYIVMMSHVSLTSDSHYIHKIGICLK